MSNHIEVLMRGGSRSGKTFCGVDACITRSLKKENTKHLILRKHFNHAKTALWYQTIPDVLSKSFPDLNYKPNKLDWFYEATNGSQLWIAGTDDKERIEKILGTEWATIYLNEASQFGFHIYDLFKRGLNPPEGMKPLYLIDYNPPNKRHWGHVIFEEGLDYETRQPIKDINRYAKIIMNPEDNRQNLSKNYFETLESMSERNKRRFKDGEYSDDEEYALWKREWIFKNRIDVKPEKMHRVIVAIDPNVTEDKKANDNTDEAGIITVGSERIGDRVHYVVLSDDTVKGLSWGKISCETYHREKADKIIAEVNQGGDLVKMNIRNYDKNVVYDDVRASRDKATRAEPVADLYRRGFVHHYGELPELEDELCTWIPGDRSPNRLDALVWGITYLMNTGKQIFIGRP